MYRQCAIALTALLLCATTPALAVILYVDDDAPPGGNGFSWDSALTQLKTALDMSSAGPTEIHIAQGTYCPDESTSNPTGSGDRNAYFRLNNGVVVLGGYAGVGAPNPDARDIHLYETVLSGDLNGDDQPGFVGMEENSYKVVYIYHGAVGTLLDGVTVRGGNADRTAVPFSLRGGGLYVLGGEPTISNCFITANAAGRSGSPEGNGGGMYIVTGTPHVEDCYFFQNKARGGGGGVYVNQVGAWITNCLFEENAGGNGGGLESFAGAADVSGCQFLRNTATQNGGGINVTGGTATITGCFLEDNVGSAYGGGMYTRGTVTVANCRIFHNEGGYGAGIHNTNSSSSGSELSLVNCVIADNPGAGVGNYRSGSGVVHTTLQNCTLTGNSLGLVDYAGAQPSNVTSCILWGNGGETEDYQLNGDSITIDYSCVQGWTGTYGGTGNFGDDPEFAGDRESSAYHVAGTSPCIDTGDPSLAPDPEDTDIDGDARVSDGNGDGIERVDVGADEYVHICGDLDFDGDVDYDDYVIFLSAFGGPVDGQPPQDAMCDYDDSGAVGMTDYAAWLDCYRAYIGDFLAGPPACPSVPEPSASIPATAHPGQSGSTNKVKASGAKRP
ncbi:MAG: right-handed parallel beta-helix repeat-containing protein [Phycisphaerae bacterium]|jgi:predicted outer membrane repeat protein